MSGYKRVNYYELCRLCATSQQKEKTHIFQEEGRKIQLLNKIQSCLSLTVYEHDFLPKVVCSKCLKSLESYYTFKQECVSSETMLSSYFKNFRYTEDFKKSGKVYIKDTSVRSYINDEASVDNVSSSSSSTAPIVVTSTQTIQVANASHNNHQPQNPSLLQNYVALTGALNEQNNKPNQSQIEQVQSFYAVQLPQTAIVTNPSSSVDSKAKPSENKLVQHNQVAYNLNAVSQVVKNQQKPQQSTTETLNNVVVNANGEVINIGHLVDLETIMNQVSSVPKMAKNSNFNNNKPKRPKESKNLEENNVVKIDLTENEQRNNNYEGDNNIKLPHIKRIQNNNNNTQKFSFGSGVCTAASSAQKIEEKIQVPTVIFNTVSEYQVPMSNFLPFHQNNNGFSNSVTTLNNNGNNNPSICNTNTTTSGNNNNNNNIVASSVHSQPQSTVNLNALNSDNDNNLGGTYNSSSSSSNNVSNGRKREGKSESDDAAAQGVVGGDKLHVCDICRRSFKRREHLYQHIKLHTGFRPYTCENCNKSFMRKEHLLRHMTSHSGQKNYTCNICEKSFSRNDNLLKHKKTHEKQNSFTCEVCQKQFVMKHYYLAHKVTHEAVERCIGQTLGILKA